MQVINGAAGGGGLTAPYSAASTEARLEIYGRSGHLDFVKIGKIVNRKIRV